VLLLLAPDELMSFLDWLALNDSDVKPSAMIAITAETHLDTFMTNPPARTTPRATRPCVEPANRTRRMPLRP
jgi:hypothetical protein